MATKPQVPKSHVKIAISMKTMAHVSVLAVALIGMNGFLWRGWKAAAS
jgi:hypothetical protein